MRQLRNSDRNGAGGSAGHIHVRRGNSQPRQTGRIVLDRPDDDDEASPPLDDDDDTVSAFVAVLILLSFETTSSSSSARHST